MVKRKKYEKLAQASPEEYIGRMNTPPAISKSYSNQNTTSKKYSGRMDTPPPLKKEKKKYFCSYCGVAFTEDMQLLLSKKAKFFCESCGERLDLFF